MLPPPPYLGGVDDALLDEVDHALVGRVEPGVVTLGLHHLIDNHRGVQSGVLGDGEAGLLEGVLDDLDALPLILVDGGQGVQQGQTPTTVKHDHGLCVIRCLGSSPDN